MRVGSNRFRSSYSAKVNVREAKRSSPMNRRQFMKTTVLSAAAASLVPEAFGKQAAEARVRVGVLGSGARAQGLMTEALELRGVEFTAVCAAYRGRAERARALTEDRARIEDDYRRILDASDVDAVLIGSPDHWHRQMSLDAL